MARLRSNIARPARLTAAVTAAVTTLPVSTTDGWPDPDPGDEALGCISYPDIDRIELFTYTGKTDDSFTGVTRGVDDTSPRAHAVRALVVHVASADELSGVSTLAALDDVDVTGVADGDALLYDTGTSTWGPGAASTVAALDDLTDVHVATAVEGDRLVFDGADWVAAPAEYVQFVYNSSGAQEGNRFNDWSDLMGALNGLAGPKLILFEQNETIPAGAWNLDNVTLRGNGKEHNAGGFTLTFGDSTTISSWANAVVNSLRLLSTSTTGPIWSPAGAGLLVLELLAGVHSTTEPFIEHSGGGQFVIQMRTNGRWKLLSGGVPNLHETSAAGTCQLVMARGDGTAFDPNTLSSDNGVILVDVVSDVANDLVAYPWPQTHSGLVTAAVVPVMQTRAIATFFDTTGLSSITEQNVQGALEELDVILTNASAFVASLPTFAQGSYTPTGTGVANVDSVTPGLATYIRVGGVVSVSGFMSVNHTTDATATVVRLSLPIASDLAAQDDLAGACGAEDNLGGMVEADDTNNEALFRWEAPTSASRFVAYSYQYRVL
jgi:hypothetical protein